MKVDVFFKQKTAYEISACLVGSEVCIRGRNDSAHNWPHVIWGIGPIWPLGAFLPGSFSNLPYC